MIPKDENTLSSIIPIEHRCSCGKLLFKGLILSSEFEIKCKACHAINVIGKDQETTPTAARYSILFNLNANIIDSSDSAKQLLGYTKEELSLMKIQEIYPLLKISTYMHLSKISKFLDVEPFTFDTLCQSKSGEFILVRINLRYLKDAAKTNTLAMFECAKLPEKLTNNPPANNKLNTHCQFISRINTEGIYTYVSTKLATLLGYPSIEMLGSPILHFYPETIKQLFSQHSKLKESFKLQSHAIFCKNKDTLNFESYFAPDFNDRGQFRGFQIMSWLIS